MILVSIALVACSTDSGGVQLPDGSDAIIVDEVVSLAATQSSAWGNGRALRALPTDGTSTAVVSTTGVYIVEPDGEMANLDLFGQSTDVSAAALSDDNSTLAVVSLWPSVVRWYDLDERRPLGVAELPPGGDVLEFGFLGGTTVLTAVTLTGVTVWPTGPDGGIATPLADAMPAGSPTFVGDALAVPIANSTEVAIVSADAVERVSIDLPESSLLLGAHSSPDGSTLAVGFNSAESGDSIAVLDAASFERLGTVAAGSAVRDGAWAVTDNAVAVADDATVTMWTHTGEQLGARTAPTDQRIEELLTHSGSVVAVHHIGAITSWSDDGVSPSTIVEAGGIALEDAVLNGELDQLVTTDFYGRISTTGLAGDGTPAHDDRFAAGEATTVAMSADANSIAVAGTNGRVTMLDPALNGVRAFAVRETPTLIDDVGFNPATGLLSTGLAERLSALAFDDTVTTWDPNEGVGVYSVGGEKEDVPDCGFFHARVAFTSDGSLLAVTSHDFTVVLFDAATGQFVHQFDRLPSTALDIAFSHDDELLVATSDLGTVTVWNVADRSVAATYDAPLGGYQAIDMLPNANVMATIDLTGNLQLIDVVSGNSMLEFVEAASPARSIALSRDGAMLAAPDEDSTVSVWSTDSGIRLATLSGHADSVTDLAFSPTERGS